MSSAAPENHVGDPRAPRWLAIVPLLFLALVSFIPVGAGHGAAPLGLIWVWGLAGGRAPMDSPIAYAAPLAVLACALDLAFNGGRFLLVRTACSFILFILGIAYILIGLSGKSGDSTQHSVPRMMVTWGSLGLVTSWFVWQAWAQRRLLHTSKCFPALFGYTASVVCVAWFAMDLAMCELAAGGGGTCGRPIACWSRGSWEQQGQLIVLGFTLDICAAIGAGVLAWGVAESCRRMGRAPKRRL